MRNVVYNDQTDRKAVLSLLLKCRAERCVSRELTPARLQLLIITRLSNPDQNARLWQDDTGQLIAAGFLLQRSTGRPLELTYFVHSGASQPDKSEILQWALERGAVIEKEQQTALRLITLVSEHHQTGIALLEQTGFTRLDDYSPCLARFLESELPGAILPPGFTIRSLANEEALEPYVALYNQVSSPVSVAQRRHLMSSIGYKPEYNLVLEAEDGRPVAFCECSASSEEWQNSTPCQGWLDHLGTHPDFQRRGFGRMITLAALQRLQTAGVQQALLITSNANIPALNLYHALGFEIIERDWIYWRTIAS